MLSPKLLPLPTSLHAPPAAASLPPPGQVSTSGMSFSAVAASSCLAASPSLRNRLGPRWMPSGLLRRGLQSSFPGFKEHNEEGQPRSFVNVSQQRKSGSLVAAASENGSKILTGENGEEVAQALQRKTDLHVVLVSPQIPGNTGCIARTCAAAAVGLHLVEPLGYEITSAKLKRAGLDYWPYVVVKIHKSWADFSKYFQQQEGEKRLLAFTKTGTIAHTEMKYRKGDWLLFGSETEGLPLAATDECLDKNHGGGLIRIPIDETYVRCLNLSVAAGIGIYEALRQLGCTESMMQRPVGDSVAIEREDIFC